MLGLAGVCAAGAGVALTGARESHREGRSMKQSVTYLHLMKKTPFFNLLNRAQKQDVIAHSTEWEVQQGVKISDRADASSHVWVLLDGGWQVEQGGKAHLAGNADPAKVYGGPAADFLSADSRLVVTKHSYVMRITRADFDRMLQEGLDFSAHIYEASLYYQRIAKESSAP
jgi:hypothetical protein